MTFKVWVGGMKRDNGKFSIFIEGKMSIGHRHRPLTQNERTRGYHLRNPVKGCRIR